jgi:hypothetical protein
MIIITMIIMMKISATSRPRELSLSKTRTQQITGTETPVWDEV